MSLEKILSELTELVEKKLNCDGCSFFLRQFTYHGEFNVQEVFPAQLFVLRESTKLHHLIGIEMFDCNEYNSSKGVTRQVAFTKRSIIVKDVANDPTWDKNKSTEIPQKDIKSALIVPVIINGEVEGVIRAIRNKTKGHFTNGDDERLMGIVNVYEEEIGEAISNGEFVSIGSSLMIDDCCARAVNIMQKLTRSKGCSIFLLDKDYSKDGTKVRYNCVNTTGLYNKNNERIDNFFYEIDRKDPKSYSLTEYSIKNKSNIFIDDIYDEDELNNYRSHDLVRDKGQGKACEYKLKDLGEPAGSIIFSPIILNRDHIPEGIIRVVKSREGIPVNKKNQNIFTKIEKVNFISLVGILSQTFCNIKYLELLDEIASSASKQEACEIAVNNISKLISCDGCSVLLYDPKLGRLEFEATLGALSNREPPLPPYKIGEGWTGWVAKHQRTLLINHRDEINIKYGNIENIAAPKHSERFFECEIGGPTADKFLCVPILRSYIEPNCENINNLIGVIRIPRVKEQFNFTKKEEELLKAIAKGLGQRILHFYYNQEVTEHKLLIEKLCTIDSKDPLFSSEEINEILFRYLTFLTHKEGLGINRAIYLSPVDLFDEKIKSIGLGPENRNHAKLIEKKIFLSPNFPPLHECYERYDRLHEFEGINNKIDNFVIDFSDECLCNIIDSNKIAFDITVNNCELNSDNLRIFTLFDLTNFFIISLNDNLNNNFYGIIIGDNVYDNMIIDEFKKELMQLMRKQIIDMFERKRRGENKLKSKFTDIVNDITTIKNAIHEIVTSNPNVPQLNQLNPILQELENTVDYSNSTK